MKSPLNIWIMSGCIWLVVLFIFIVGFIIGQGRKVDYLTFWTMIGAVGSFCIPVVLSGWAYFNQKRKDEKHQINQEVELIVQFVEANIMPDTRNFEYEFVKDYNYSKDKYIQYLRLVCRRWFVLIMSNPSKIYNKKILVIGYIIKKISSLTDKMSDHSDLLGETLFNVINLLSSNIRAILFSTNVYNSSVVVILADLNKYMDINQEELKDLDFNLWINIQASDYQEYLNSRDELYNIAVKNGVLLDDVLFEYGKRQHKIKNMDLTVFEKLAKKSKISREKQTEEPNNFGNMITLIQEGKNKTNLK